MGCGPVLDGSPIGDFFFRSFASFGAAIAARDAAVAASPDFPSRIELGFAELLGAASGRIAGRRVVESIRVGGTASPSSASE